MLESNKDKKNYILIIIILYAIIAILVTTYLIYEKNNQACKSERVEFWNINDEVVEKKIDYSHVKRVNLLDKYALNNIKTDEEYKYFGEPIGYDYDGTPQYKTTVYYTKISGLKNKIIENKINTKIEDTIDSLIDKDEMANKDIEHIYINSNVYANFSNVLSIYISKSVDFIEDNKYENTNIGLNFRLDTGELFKLKDVFTEDASIKSILAQSLYNNLGFEYGMGQEDFDGLGDLDKISYSQIENDVYRIIYKYNQNPDAQFFFMFNSLYVDIDNRTIEVDMKEFYNYINIYNLVTTETSLYEDGDKERINYVFGMPIFESYEKFEKISDNIFLAIYNLEANFEGNENYNQQYEEHTKLINDYKDKIVDVIKMQNVDNNKAYIYNINYLDKNNGILNAFGDKVEVDKNNFDKEIENVFSKASREISGDTAISFFCLDGEYNVFNVRITEKAGKLNIEEEDIASFYDI